MNLLSHLTKIVFFRVSADSKSDGSLREDFSGTDETTVVVTKRRAPPAVIHGLKMPLPETVYAANRFEYLAISANPPLPNTLQPVGAGGTTFSNQVYPLMCTNSVSKAASNAPGDIGFYDNGELKRSSGISQAALDGVLVPAQSEALNQPKLGQLIAVLVLCSYGPGLCTSVLFKAATAHPTPSTWPASHGLPPEDTTEEGLLWLWHLVRPALPILVNLAGLIWPMILLRRRIAAQEPCGDFPLLWFFTSTAGSVTMAAYYRTSTPDEWDLALMTSTCLFLAYILATRLGCCLERNISTYTAFTLTLMVVCLVVMPIMGTSIKDERVRQIVLVLQPPLFLALTLLGYYLAKAWQNPLGYRPVSQQVDGFPQSFAMHNCENRNHPRDDVHDPTQTQGHDDRPANRGGTLPGDHSINVAAASSSDSCIVEPQPSRHDVKQAPCGPASGSRVSLRRGSQTSTRRATAESDVVTTNPP